jgi:hypothetical protein
MLAEEQIDYFLRDHRRRAKTTWLWNGEFGGCRLNNSARAILKQECVRLSLSPNR